MKGDVRKVEREQRSAAAAFREPVINFAVTGSQLMHYCDYDSSASVNKLFVGCRGFQLTDLNKVLFHPLVRDSTTCQPYDSRQGLLFLST